MRIEYRLKLINKKHLLVQARYKDTTFNLVDIERGKLHRYYLPQEIIDSGIYVTERGKIRYSAHTLALIGGSPVMCSPTKNHLTCKFYITSSGNNTLQLYDSSTGLYVFRIVCGELSLYDNAVKSHRPLHYYVEDSYCIWSV